MICSTFQTNFLRAKKTSINAERPPNDVPWLDLLLGSGHSWFYSWFCCWMKTDWNLIKKAGGIKEQMKGSGKLWAKKRETVFGFLDEKTSRDEKWRTPGSGSTLFFSLCPHRSWGYKHWMKWCERCQWFKVLTALDGNKGPVSKFKVRKKTSTQVF